MCVCLMNVLSICTEIKTGLLYVKEIEFSKWPNHSQPHVLTSLATPYHVIKNTMNLAKVLYSDSDHGLSKLHEIPYPEFVLGTSYLDSTFGMGRLRSG